MEKYIDDQTNTFLLVNMAARWVGARLGEYRQCVHSVWELCV